MNKVLSKAVMNRSRLRNKFTKDPTIDNEKSYKKQRNYCVNLFKKEKNIFSKTLIQQKLQIIKDSGKQ